jgi:hypothetical protein
MASEKENRTCSGVVRVPPRTAKATPVWPPAWLSALETGLPGGNTPSSEAEWARLESHRWGPALDHNLSGIDVPRDWRSLVAGLPHDAWAQWRSRVAELLQDLDHAPTADEIREADRQAAVEMDIPGVDQA